MNNYCTDSLLEARGPNNPPPPPPPSLPTQPKNTHRSAWSNHQVFRSKQIPFAHSLTASSFLITRTHPVHVELRRKIKMDNRKVFAHTDKLVIGEKQSYSSSSSSSARSAMTTASKREWSLVDNKKDYATEDVPDTAVWEEPSDDAAAMEEEWPAMAIDSFGYDGDDGDLPATSGSNVLTSSPP